MSCAPCARVDYAARNGEPTSARKASSRRRRHPVSSEIRAFIAHLEGPGDRSADRDLAGLRSSELRGLRWNDVDLKHNKLHVRQRADRYNALGSLKSEAANAACHSRRAHQYAAGMEARLSEGRARAGIPQWRRPHPKSCQHHQPRVDPCADRRRESTANGKAKYTGLHSLRHFYAAGASTPGRWRARAPLKVVQARLGHTSIQMTADRYGHLFPSGDDGTEMAEAEKAFLP